MKWTEAFVIVAVVAVLLVLFFSSHSRMKGTTEPTPTAVVNTVNGVQ